MAERRMFTKKITESDAFLEMPMSSQALYFHLCMNADDDGFVKNPKSIQRLVGCNDDDLKLLIAKRFVIPFDSGIIVIKHWRMHNLLRKDRYKETVYTDERALLFLKEDGAYTLDEKQGIPIPKIGAGEAQNEEEKGSATNWQPNGNQMAPQDRSVKDSIKRLIKKDKIEMISRAYEGVVPHMDLVEKVLDALEFACSMESPRTYNGKKYSADDFWAIGKALNTDDIVYIINRILPHMGHIEDFTNYAISIIAECSEHSKK